MFDFKGQVEDDFGGAAVFATVRSTPRYCRVVRVHDSSSRFTAPARFVAPRSSSSTKASSSACSLGGNAFLWSRARRQRQPAPVVPELLDALLDWISGFKRR